MTELRHSLILRAVKALDVILVTFPFAVCWYRYYAFDTVSPFYRKGNWAVILLFLALYIIFGKLSDGFQISLNRILEIIYSQVLAVFASDSVMYAVTCLLMKRLPALPPLLVCFVCQVLLATVWAFGTHKWYFACFPPERSAIVYDRRQGMEQLIGEYGLGKRFDIQLVVSVEECLGDIRMLDGMKAVFFSGIRSHDRNILLKYCVGQGIASYVIPRVGDSLMSGAKMMHMFHLPILMVRRYSPDIIYLFIKRLSDIVLSLAALVITSPVLLITAVTV